MFSFWDDSGMGLANDINEKFNGMNEIINSVYKIVSRPLNSADGIWELISSIYSILLPVGFSLLALFFLIGFINKAAMFKLVRVENIVKMLIMVVIAKYVMQNSFMLLNFIYDYVSSMINAVGINGQNIIDIVDAKALAAEISKMNLMGRMMFQLQFFCISLILTLANTFIQVICYGRMIELGVFTAISPIPLATIISEEYSSTAKRFFQQYIALCLQGLVILISCMFYGGLANTIISPIANTNFEAGMMGSICISLVLLMVLMKSEAWAQKIVGV